MSYKIKYYLKRYGIIGSCMMALNRMNITNFDLYRYVQHRYFEKLKKDKYETELADWYMLRRGRSLRNIQHPTTFNDKIQWLKIHDNTKLRAICSDKLQVREYVKKLNLEGLNLIPLLGSWRNAEDIDFSLLPESFVLKQNAACKLNLVVEDKNKLNEKKVRELMCKWLDTTYGYNGMECQYLELPKSIIAEEYLQELDGNLFDYKIFCFNGVPKFIEVIGDRGKNHKTGLSAFVNLEWQQLDFGTATYPRYEVLPDKPRSLAKMVEIAAALSKPFRFVRVDLYDLDGKIYFGELTFTPTNGIAIWEPEEANVALGKLIALDCI